ncbi:MAG: glycosyltransferase family 39 protein [Candidatus Shapirobacteria bacterium]|jgi:4-amino-4-deoxy-L-arabinose transferase-like glycosyltransferase
MKKISLIYIFIILLGFLFFSYKITSIPPGLETDEGSISYNSALISQNLKDQNNRFLPIFILSSDKNDWKQPVLIYFIAILFRLFGKTFFVYKLANIIFSLLSGIFLIKIINLLFKNKIYSIIGFLIYITTPIIFITTRIGNESLLPSLISSLWLLSLLLYKSKHKSILLIINALSIGIGFYSFKGMRIISPIWSIISFIYIYILAWNKNFTIKKNILNKNNISKIALFSLTVLPFFLITPILELKYAGAVFDRQSVSIISIYNFFYYWLSNLSLSFWFTTPDVGKVYNIATFGAIFMFFIPFFIIGIFNAIKRKNDLLFILICLVLTPSLFGVARSVNYTHRLTACLPFIIILIVYGIKIIFESIKFNKYKQYIYIVFILLFSLSFIDFYSFYFFEYPKLHTTQQAFGKYTLPFFIKLSELSNNFNLKPYVQEYIYNSEGDEHNFYNIIYFNNKINIWKLGDNLPNKSILLTENDNIKGFTNSGFSSKSNLYILIKND